MTENDRLVTALKDLFKTTYLTNCRLENIITSPEETKMLLSIDSIKLIENLKMLIQSLLVFKENTLHEDKAELIQRNEQFEAMLQKLEAEVRLHIGIENELKLHIENSKCLTEELEQQKAQYLQEIKDLTEKVKDYQRSHQNLKDPKEFIDKIDQLENNLMRKNNIIHKLELDFIKLKSMMDKTHIDTSQSKLKKARIEQRKQEIYEEIKGKVDQKNLGLMRIQHLLRQKSKEKTKSMKKMKESPEPICAKPSEPKLVPNLIQNAHARSVSEQVRYNSVGRRTPLH